MQLNLLKSHYFKTFKVSKVRLQKTLYYNFLFFVFFSILAGHSCHGKAEECIGLCRTLLGVLVWLLQGCAWYCEKLREPGLPASTEASLRACQERLHTLMSSTKNRALIHIARLEEQGGFEIYIGRGTNTMFT